MMHQDDRSRKEPKSYDPALLEQLSREIIQMGERDFAARKPCLIFNEKGENVGFDHTKLDVKVDIANMARMREIVDMIGWPSISKVGKEATAVAARLLLHVGQYVEVQQIIEFKPDVEFQQRCLNLMKKCTDIDPENAAKLEDKINLNLKKPQRYGTQLIELVPNKPLILYDVENPLELNRLRESVGLEPHVFARPIEDNLDGKGIEVLIDFSRRPKR